MSEFGAILQNAVFLFGILNSVVSPKNGCNGPIIPDLPRRVRNYTATGSSEDPYISDENLGSFWYSANNYRMSDSSNMPKIRQCGTELPIYIKGKHPTKEEMLDGEQVKVSTCEMFPWDDCENERTIYVMLCKGLFHYVLQQTSVNAGYCFESPDTTDRHNITDPPNVQNITDATNTPGNSTDPQHPLDHNNTTDPSEPFERQNATVLTNSVNESSTRVLSITFSEKENASFITVVVSATLGAVVAAVIVGSIAFFVYRRRTKQTQNELQRTDTTYINTSLGSTTNDKHVYFNNINDDGNKGELPPDEPHVYDQLPITNSEHTYTELC